MNKLKFYHEEKDLIVTLTPNDGGFDFVVIGDENKLSDRELIKMTSGIAPIGWIRQ